jgi:hypothetical protein
MDLAHFAVLFFCYYLFIFSGNLYVIGFTWFFYWVLLNMFPLLIDAGSRRVRQVAIPPICYMLHRKEKTIKNKKLAFNYTIVYIYNWIKSLMLNKRCLYLSLI